jgi:hypothetical protein
MQTQLLRRSRADNLRAMLVWRKALHFLTVTQMATGDVWNVQPAPKEHVWRTMKNPLGGGNGMVPHYSGTTLDAQARYANGTKSILENYLGGKPQEVQNIIVGLGSSPTLINLAKRLTFVLGQANTRPVPVSHMSAISLHRSNPVCCACCA